MDAPELSETINPEPETATSPDEIEGEHQRLSKLLSAAGIASRRAAEDMIADGRVTVNGHTIREQGFKADPLNDKIVVDGHPLKISSAPKSVVLFHKPKNVMTTRDDPGRRSTVFDLLPKKYAHFHTIGRLDYDTSGVLLLTDDGELTHLLTHPSHGAEKVYEARVRGQVSTEALEKLRRGVQLDDGPTAPCRARILAQRDKNALVELVLREGRNRQVRRMLEAVGHPVSALRRVKFASVELEGLPAGELRVLLAGEVKALRKRVEGKVKKVSSTPRKKPFGARKTITTGQKMAPAQQKIGATQQKIAAPTPKKPAEKKKMGAAPVARRVAQKWKDV